MRKTKLKWFWGELYRLTPQSVERCACVAQLTSARRLLQSVYQERLDLATKDGASDEDLEAMAVDLKMQELDEKHKVARRWLWASLLLVGLVLTIQPWYPIRWFATVILAAGLMLCGLEFSPRKGQGFAELVLRIRSSKNQAE